MPANHVIINQAGVAFFAAPSVAGVTGEGMPVRVNLTDILRHFRPWPFSPFGSISDFPGQDPHDGIGTITRNQIAPVALDSVRSELLHAVAVTPSPCADNCRDNTSVNQKLKPPVRKVKILGIDYAHILRQIRLPSLVFQAGRKEVLIGIGTADDVDHIEAFRFSVGGQFLKPLPDHPLTETFPPGVRQPQKWRAVSMFEVTLARRRLHETMLQQGFVAFVGTD